MHQIPLSMRQRWLLLMAATFTLSMVVAQSWGWARM
jgi:hypothetical protein